jgi:hypothetical protein
MAFIGAFEAAVHLVNEIGIVVHRRRALIKELEDAAASDCSKRTQTSRHD